VDGIGGFAKFSVPRIEVGDEVVIPQVKLSILGLSPARFDRLAQSPDFPPRQIVDRGQQFRTDRDLAAHPSFDDGGTGTLEAPWRRSALKPSIL